MKAPTILIVEDDEVACKPIVDCLKHMRYRPVTCSTGAEVMPVIQRCRPRAILLDIRLPDTDGITTLKEIKRAYEDLPVIVITGFGTVDDAVDCMKYGAYDFLTKPLDFTRLGIVVGNALELRKWKEEADRRPTLESYSFGDLVGISPQMQTVYRIIANVAKSEATVFITGESGTGKELVARSIHDRSKRSRGPFMAVNCAAIPRELLESELFGHEKGAFTGAISRHIGCCEATNGGTLFLDEICDMGAELQVKLLRFLQDRTFQRVGGTETLTADVRLISATNKDPLKEVEKGTFREDFYYRLMVVPVELPPLRERAGDIPLLATHFLEKCAARHKKKFDYFSPEALHAILNYPWTGNVRELENVIERVVVLSDGPTVTLANLPSEVVHRKRLLNSTAEKRDEPSPREEKVLPLSEIVKKAIREALAGANGDVSLAAKQLDLPEETVREKAQKYGLSRAW